MKIEDSIMLGHTDAILNYGDLYYLSYPIESTLMTYLVYDVLTLNDRFNAAFQWSRPCSWFIGDFRTLDSLTSAINCDDWHKRMGKYKYCNYVRPAALLEDVYSHILKYEPPLVLISGFNNITFKPSEMKMEVNFFLDDLRRLLADFPSTTILLTGTTFVKNGDLDRCIPKMNVPDELELETTASTEIPSKIGALKLFHLPKEVSTSAVK